MSNDALAQRKSGRWVQLRLLLHAAMQAAVMSAVLGLLLFMPAQDLDWPMAWAFLIVYIGGIFITNLWLVLRHTGLAGERLLVPATAETWDLSITRLANFILLGVMLPLSGLDYHRQWTPLLPLEVSLFGLLVIIAGFLQTGWAMSSNEYFSSVIRAQTDRGQTVASGGPYRFIRHPGYLAMIAQFLVAPIVLGSLWALLPAVAVSALYIRRIKLEEVFLRNRLPGYAEYAKRVRWRLLPGIW